MTNPHVEKIALRNPDPLKKGVSIDKSKYDVIRPIILEYLKNNRPATFSQVAEEVENRLSGRFEGSISWYTISVKLDMEARGEIIRIQVKGHDLMTLPEN
jgi:hypothetical protein